MRTSIPISCLTVLAVLIGASYSCPNKCTCIQKSVLCLDSSIVTFPSGIAASTEILKIEGTEERPLQLRQLGSRDLKSLPSLKTLIISYTLLDTVDEAAFKGLTHLTWLDLSFNRLTSLSSAVFNGLTSLQSLHLTGNKHLHLPSTVFQGISSLQELFMSYMALDSLDLRLFNGLDLLQSLDLSGNELWFLPEEMSNVNVLKSLQHLVLSFNHFTTLGNESAPLLERISTVSLDNNPWECSCELRWLLPFTRHIFPPHEGPKAVTCEGPPALTFQTLALLQPQKLICIAPAIQSCDSVEPQPLAAPFTLRCNMTGVPFPYVSWTTPDGAETMGSSRRQMSPQVSVRCPTVSISLMASTATNGTLTVIASNVLGRDTEQVNVFVKPPTTTTSTTTTTRTTTITRPIKTFSTAPKTEAHSTKPEDKAPEDKKKEENKKEKEEGGSSGMMYIFISAGIGGAALLVSSAMMCFACRKMRMDRAVKPVDPEKTQAQAQLEKNDKTRRISTTQRKTSTSGVVRKISNSGVVRKISLGARSWRGERDDRKELIDDFDNPANAYAEMGEVRQGGYCPQPMSNYQGGRASAASMSAWDV